MNTAVQPAADITITAPTVEYKGGAVMTPMAMIDRALATGANCPSVSNAGTCGS